MSRRRREARGGRKTRLAGRSEPAPGRIGIAGAIRLLHASVLIVSSIGLLAGCFMASVRASDQDVVERGPIKAFPHGPHVADSWRDGEVLRDCLGCHADPRSGAAPSVGADVCVDCHYDGFTPEPGALRLADSSRVFRHRDHFGKQIAGGPAAQCIDCHFPGEQVPDDIPVPVGIPTCIECHSPGIDEPPPERLQARGEALTRMLARLNDARIAELGPRRFDKARDDGTWVEGFRHEDHVAGWPDVRSAEGSGVCTSCHRGVERSNGLAASDDALDSDLGELFVSLTTCGDCHVTENGAAVRFELAARPRRHLSAGTFSHAEHLASRSGDPPAAGNDELDLFRAEIAADGCLACHEPARRGRESGGPRRDTHRMSLRADRLGGDESLYAFCVSCHDHWTVRARRADGIDEPSHADLVKDLGRFGGAGTVDSGRGACAKCHELGHFQAMALRATPVVRGYPESFQISRQAHPFVHSTSATTVFEPCMDCHQAGLSDNVSRVGVESFRHDSHLPRLVGHSTQTRDSISKRCVVCHISVAESPGPIELTGTDRFDTRELPICRACHVASDLQPFVVPEVRLDVRRYVFSHADHFGRPDPSSGGRDVFDCTSCHRAEPPAAEPIEFLDGVADCTRCHGHADAPADTGKVSAEWVKNCANCHDEGIPEAGSPAIEETGWTTIAAVGSRQFHPPDAVDAERCVSCHRVQHRQPRRARVRSADRFFASGYFRGQRDRLPPGARTQFHEEGQPADPQGRLQQCADCHWGDMFRERARLCPGTEASRVRSRLGADLFGFPGRSTLRICE